MQGTQRGVFRGPGTPLKHGLTYALVGAHRMEVDRELTTGHLREFEQRFVRGELADYPLFMAGDLVEGALPFTHTPELLTYERFLGRKQQGRCTGYYAVEKAAGVAQIDGRAPYGFKYLMADMAVSVAGTLGIVDAVAINLVTAHDTQGTTTDYRRKVRRQPEVLLNTGRIIWGVRKRLRDIAERGLVAEMTGVPLDAPMIADYRVHRNGVTLRLVKGDGSGHAAGGLWVPWAALVRAGQPAQRLTVEEARETHVIDDDTRVITFPQVRVTLDLKRMLSSASDNEGRDPRDAVRLKDPVDLAPLSRLWLFGTRATRDAVLLSRVHYCHTTGCESA